MEASSSIVPTGETVVMDGVNYSVFETGIPGIGFILGLKDTNATTWIPLQTEIIQTYPTDEANSSANDLGWSAKVSFIKTGSPLKSGNYTIPSITAAVLTAYNNETATAKVIINSTTVIVSATGCTISTPSVAINLGTVDMHILSAVDSTSELKNFNVSLQCDANISLNAVITDQTDQSNISQIVSLTPDSTATGVGVQFFYNGTGPLSLGPDSSLNSTPNQFFITSTSQAENLSLPFQARYIRTGAITPGTANALASITFSYQ
ncbi:fimbrial protein [Gibbsiella greigii]